MSSEGNEDEVVEFEELPELTGADQIDNQESSEDTEGTEGSEGFEGAEGGEEIDAAKGKGYKGPGYRKPDKDYKKPPKKGAGYGCPAGQQWDPKTKKCVPIKKGGEGFACPEGQELDPDTGECVPKKGGEGQDFKGKNYTCPTGEVWDDGKKKCVPIKAALEERDAKIKQLTEMITTVQAALRMKEIETTVDEQISAGHLAPVQREKAINFISAMPDEKMPDFLGILAHQKFPLGEETGNTIESAPPGGGKKGIGESEEITDLKAEDKKTLLERFHIDELVEERGVRKTKKGD